MDVDVENEKSTLRETSNAETFRSKIFQNVLQILYSQETGNFQNDCFCHKSDCFFSYDMFSDSHYA